MRGLITRKEVLMHSLTIVRLFGLRAFSRCLRAAFSARPTTFLETVLGPVVVRGAASQRERVAALRELERDRAV